MKERIARLISNVLNPFVASTVVLALLSFEDTGNAAAALKWTAIALAMSVLPLLFTVIYLVRNQKMNSFFNNTRWERRSVYLMGCALGGIGCGVMWGLGAPRLLALAFTAGLAAMFIFAGINLYWKISLHTAFTAAAATVLSLVYGAAAAWTLVLVPLVGWARIKLEQHSLAQVTTGAVLAAGIVAGVFKGLGLG